MTIRIIMLGWELPPRINGGLGVACAGLRRALWQTGGVEVCFVVPRLFGGESRAEGHLAELLPSCRSPVYGASCHADAFAFAEATARLDGDADLIHAHDWLTIPAALALRARLCKPLVLHIHSTEYDRAGPLADESIVAIERAGMDAAMRIVAVSEATRRHIVRRYRQDPDKVTVVYNGVDLPPAMPRKVAQPIVSFIGRVTYQKGPLCFVEAAWHMLRSVPDLRFVLAGDGDMLDSARDLARTLGLESRMTFPGFLDRSEVEALLARSTVFVMPSVAEPFGLIALEAMAAGTPVVLSRDAGVAEIVAAATRVDPGNAASVAAAALALIHNPGLARAQAVEAQREARALGWSVPAGLLLDIYRACLDEESRGGSPCSSGKVFAAAPMA